MNSLCYNCVMNIQILYGIYGARTATGTCVIVDVFRAATVAAYLLNQGAKYIIPVKTKEEALSLKKNYPEYILIGEEGAGYGGYQIPGFDYGNSPSKIAGTDFTGKIIVHRTSQGTQGLTSVDLTKEVIFGSFVTISAVANFIKKEKPKNLSIVAMAGKNSDDEQFAILLSCLLKGAKYDLEKIIEKIKIHPHVQKFLDPNLPKFPSADFNLCTQIDAFNFICKAETTNNQLRIYKKYPE